jgi:hypothetical protein
MVMLCGIMVACFQAVTFADEEKQESKTTISGFGYFMVGQIVSGWTGSEFPDPAYAGASSQRIAHYWQENAEVDLFLTSKPNDWFTTKVGLTVRSYNPLQSGSMEKASFYTNFLFSIPAAEGIFNWKFSDAPVSLSSLLVEAGFFQYTFNPDAKNLGNYLYRSVISPLSIWTKIDYPWADLMGVRTEVGFLDNKIKIGAIFNSTVDFLPWYDWNLAFTGHYAPNKIINVAAAIEFDRLVSVGHSNTWLNDSICKKMAGTKIAARFSFDPKPLFGSLSFFGPEDCKLYGEAAVIGQNDSTLNVGDTSVPHIGPPIYWMGMPIRRMPLLLGINIPGFKVLDVISLELEWFKSPYPNDWQGALTQGGNAEPVPLDISGSPWLIDNYVKKDNFKWSIYAKKRVFSNFEVMVFAANDHTIYKAFNLGSNNCPEQSLRKPNDWHWYGELRFYF